MCSSSSQVVKSRSTEKRDGSDRALVPPINKESKHRHCRLALLSSAQMLVPMHEAPLAPSKQRCQIPSASTSIRPPSSVLFALAVLALATASVPILYLVLQEFTYTKDLLIIDELESPLFIGTEHLLVPNPDLWTTTLGIAGLSTFFCRCPSFG